MAVALVRLCVWKRCGGCRGLRSEPIIHEQLDEQIHLGVALGLQDGEEWEVLLAEPGVKLACEVQAYRCIVTGSAVGRAHGRARC